MDVHVQPGAKIEGKLLRQNLLFCLLVTLLGVFASAFSAVADHVAAAFGQDAAMAGMYLSVYGTGSCVSAFFGGALADRFGKRKVIVVSVALLAAGLICASLTGNQLVTLMALFLAGVGFGPSEAMSSALLTDENPAGATRWMNISQIGFGLGAIFAPVAAVWMIAQGLSYRHVFGVCALMLASLMAAIQVTGRGRPVKVNRSGSMNSLELLKNKRFLLYALMVFFYLGYESVASITFKQLFMGSGASEGAAAAAISLFWGSMLVCRFLGVFLGGREILSIRALGVVTLVGIAFLLTAQSDFMRIIGVALYGFGCGPVWPMLFVLSSHAFPERTGAAYGVMMLFSTAGNALFPVLIGSGVGDPRVTIMICAVFCAMVVCATFFVGSKS